MSHAFSTGMKREAKAGGSHCLYTELTCMYEQFYDTVSLPRIKAIAVHLLSHASDDDLVLR